MQVPVDHKTLAKAMDAPNLRIVLGAGAFTFVYVVMGIWVAGVMGIVAFFWSAVAATPGADTNDVGLPLAIIAGAVAWAYLLVGWRSRLILDLAERTYRYEFGLPPLMKRRRGALDDFSHVSLTVHERTSGYFANRYLVSQLTLVPQEGGAATKPIVVAFSPNGDQSEAHALYQRLAESLGLPFRDESLEIVPQPSVSTKGCLIVLAVFVGLAAALGGYGVYQSRGPRYPLRVGAAQPIQAPLGACRVRTLEVKAGESYRTFQAGGGGPDGMGSSVTTHTPYSVTLDIENPGASAASVHFVLGFDARHRAEGTSGPLAPRAHRRVTVDLESVGDNPPESLFLRAED